MKKKIFIDGEEGTTGLQINAKLSSHPNIELLSIDSEKRKDLKERQKMMGLSDLTFLCLPDEAAINAVKISKDLPLSDIPIIIDASSAHRISEDWTYGLPELSKYQKEKISNSRNISVPGCYATGANILINPLIKNSILSKETLFTIYAISGFSGGGKKLINHFNENEYEPFFYYGLNLDHKHLPEIKFCNSLKQNPIFVPSVANFYQGMIVTVPLHLKLLNAGFNYKDVEEIYKNHYKESYFISVNKVSESMSENGFFRPDKIINTNKLNINLFVNDDKDQVILTSNYDNLGKGASSAAIQCMNLVFGFPENLSLD